MIREEYFSDAGKTTLLNTLVNLSSLEMNGEVCVNGNEVGRDIVGISCYVQ
jgi:ABC-type multidrug transport system ATPase subunit